MIGKRVHCAFMNFGHRVINISIPHSWRGRCGIQCFALKETCYPSALALVFLFLICIFCQNNKSAKHKISAAGKELKHKKSSPFFANYRAVSFRENNKPNIYLRPILEGKHHRLVLLNMYFSFLCMGLSKIVKQSQQNIR